MAAEGLQARARGESGPVGQLTSHRRPAAGRILLLLRADVVVHRVLRLSRGPEAMPNWRLDQRSEHRAYVLGLHARKPCELFDNFLRGTRGAANMHASLN